ncbi:putative efflux protein, MATE family [Ruminococcaceae bacterium YRB3002]|nr:putative efflux protein, MATE family [Ruminococcaceae bacterium YRB3002]
MLMGVKAKQRDFGTGSIPKIVLAQAVPLTASQLASLLYNIVDRIYIGHIPGVGTDALTGLGLTFPIITMISAFTLLAGQGGAPLFSMSRGAGDDKKAKKYMDNSFIMLLGLSLILTAAALLFKRGIIYALGGGDVTYPYAEAYLNIYLWGTPLLMLSTGMNFYITSQGYPVHAMVTTMAGAVVNTVLDPVFIFALGMGIRGAAVATLISQTVSFVWVMAFLTGKKSAVRLRIHELEFSPKICGRILTLGFTGFVMEFTNSAVQMVCNRQLKIYGGDIYVGIMTIVNSVRSIMGLAVTGITSGAQPVLGFNYGAGKNDRVKDCIRFTFWLAAGYTLVAWLVILLVPGFFIGIFSDDAALNDVAVPYLHIYFMVYIFMALQFSGQSTFMGLGKAGRAVFFSIFRKLILVVPLTLVLPLFMDPQVQGVFWAEPISNIVGGTASFVAMYVTLYRKLGNNSASLSRKTA